MGERAGERGNQGRWRIGPLLEVELPRQALHMYAFAYGALEDGKVYLVSGLLLGVRIDDDVSLGIGQDDCVCRRPRSATSGDSYWVRGVE